MREVPLSSGKIAIVDDADYAGIAPWEWSAQKGHGRDGLWYAYRTTYSQGGTRRKIFMHRQILGLAQGDGLCVDHVNGDGLDNRRANLRLATHAKNLANRPAPRSNTSGFKGVYFNRVVGKWQAYIGVEYRTIYLGLFDSPEEASAAYEKAAERFQGGFAFHLSAGAVLSEDKE